jgi:hypothetical protein
MEPYMSKTPRINTPGNKAHRSAAGLLGRQGSGGLGIAPASGAEPIAPVQSDPSKQAGHGGHTGSTSNAGPNPATAGKRSGKPETRRPTGRAISGG